MFHYLFTNDLRISKLESSLVQAAECFSKNSLPSDKSLNNNMNTLGFYFNLTNGSGCTTECLKGNTRKVVLNFIKKFQFPNPRTHESFQDCLNDGIQIAPLRIILQVLYIMHMINPSEAYLFKNEVATKILFNPDIAQNGKPDIIKLANEILNNPNRKNEDLPDEDTLTQQNIYWKQYQRQIGEMIKVLTWSGCVTVENNALKIQHKNLTVDNKADIFEIISYNSFWVFDKTQDKQTIKASYQAYMDIDSIDKTSNLLKSVPLIFNTKLECKLPRNRIVFGAPGTGKSFLINSELTRLLNEFNVGDDNYERVTFHPDYSYANFVGTYKPVMVECSNDQNIDSETKVNLDVLKDPNKSAQEKYDFFYDNGQDIGLTRIPILIGIATDEPFHTKKTAGDDAANDNIVERNHGIALRKYVQLKGENSDIKSSEISYKYVPGPFMRMYVKALQNAQKVANKEEEPQPFLLIIEEINRANVAAVFGDIFQLLDRDDDNVSEYPIQASEDIKKYLAENLGGAPENYAKIKIPDNLFIWATMNSADQGVFPMDTAFKRRWDFTYLGIDDNDENLKDKFVLLGKENPKYIEWNSLRKAINEFLANEKINEDKQLGPYFIAKDIVIPTNGIEIDKDKFNDVFKHKVLMYLFDDAAKQKRSKLFEGVPAESSRYSKICKAFEEKGIDIFHSSIREMVTTRGDLKEEKDSEPLNETEDWKASDA